MAKTAAKAHKTAVKRKTTAAKPKKKRRASPVGSRLDQVILLMLSGVRSDALPAAVMKRLRIKDQAAADELVGQARVTVRAAAEFDRDEQLAYGILRLNALYEKSVAKRNYALALKIQVALTRLLSIGAGAGDGASSAEQLSAAQSELAAVREHLVPLNLPAPADAPAGELARLAVERIVSLSGGPR